MRLPKLLRTFPRVSEEKSNEMEKCLQKIDDEFEALTIHLVLNGEGGSLFAFEPGFLSKEVLLEIYERLVRRIKDELFAERLDRLHEEVSTN